MKKSSLISFFYVIGFIILLGSCTPIKNAIYFESIQKDTTLRNLVDRNMDLKIRKNDLLSINIISPDPVTTPLFNGMPAGAGLVEGAGTNTGGYQVDNNGNIVMYKLGIVRVEGLTRNELRQKLMRDLGPYLKDAVVSVRFLSNKVTLLGEVSKPQVLTMPEEELTILDAIGLSGDLTIEGRKDNVLLIRQTESGRQFKRLNLTDKSIFYSPFFYLKPDDIVYVEPTKYKLRNSAQTQQTMSYILSGISIFITIFALLR